MSPSPPHQEPAADLLEHLLGSLLADFSVWFSRGELLLDLCPDRVMAPDQREDLRRQLEEARRQLAAATSLRRAAPVPMALGMDSLAPWHQLVLRVWSLSASLRRGGVDLPPMDRPMHGPMHGPMEGADLPALAAGLLPGDAFPVDAERLDPSGEADD